MTFVSKNRYSTRHTNLGKLAHALIEAKIEISPTFRFVGELSPGMAERIAHVPTGIVVGYLGQRSVATVTYGCHFLGELMERPHDMLEALFDKSVRDEQTVYQRPAETNISHLLE